MGHVTLTMLIKSYYVTPSITLDLLYLCTKFDDSSSSQSRDMLAHLKLKTGLVTLTTQLLGVVCHLKARI